MTVSARLLQVLSLLQARPSSTGQQLAERLGVSARTVRSDIDKLRELGYPVHAVPGVAGGYRLAPGAKLPPLLLDDDEATAVAIGLNSAAGGAVAGIEEAATRALAKLEQVLPSRLRHRIELLRTSTVTPRHGGPIVAPEVLTVIAAACRDHHRLRFDYRTHDGTDQHRRVEPHRLVHLGRKWYLVGWDPDRADWRTFRADRMLVKSEVADRIVTAGRPWLDVSTSCSYIVLVETIGLRELNQNPSRAVARVRAGESLVVTDRGKPVLRMVPVVESPGILSRLVAEGTVRAPAEQGMPELIPDLAPDVESAADLLLADRERERGR